MQNTQILYLSVYISTKRGEEDAELHSEEVKFR